MIEQKIHSLLKNNYAVVIDGKETFHYNEHRPFNPASIIKLFILYASLKAIDNEKVEPHTLLTLEQEPIVPGAGVLQFLKNKTYRFDDLLTLMIAYSDNTATNLIISYLGIDYIQGHIKALGIKNTFLRRKLYHMKPGIYNESTAFDTYTLLKSLYTGQNLSQRSHHLGLEILSHQQIKHLSSNLQLCARCKKLVSDNLCTCGLSVKDADPIPVESYSKSGAITGHVHDACIMVLDNQPIYIIIFTRNQENNARTEETLQTLGHWLYEHFKEASC